MSQIDIDPKIVVFDLDLTISTSHTRGVYNSTDIVDSTWEINKYFCSICY